MDPSSFDIFKNLSIEFFYKIQNSIEQKINDLQSELKILEVNADYTEYNNSQDKKINAIKVAGELGVDISGYQKVIDFCLELKTFKEIYDSKGWTVLKDHVKKGLCILAKEKQILEIQKSIWEINITEQTSETIETMHALEKEFTLLQSEIQKIQEINQNPSTEIQRINQIIFEITEHLIRLDQRISELAEKKLISSSPEDMEICNDLLNSYETLMKKYIATKEVYNERLKVLSFKQKHSFCDFRNQENLALILETTYDWEGAFDLSVPDKLEEGYQILFKKISSVKEISETISEVSNKTNRISILWLRAHGSPFEIKFGYRDDLGYRDNQNLDETNVWMLENSFSKLNLDAVIVLDSCSTCAPLPDGMENIAQKIAKYTGKRRVIGPKLPLYAAESRKIESVNPLKLKFLTPVLHEGKTYLVDMSQSYTNP